ncbi:MAG: rod shape-determining protein MreD [Bacteroidaceae bacterium]|nr:rod shape-determining protein MreD [Bacteroidaceae bacterium]
MTFLTRLAQFMLLLALQVLVFNHIHLFGYATPILTSALLLYFPQKTTRIQLLVWSFVMGLCVDVFSNTPGVCSGSMTFVAMLRPFLLALQAPKDSDETLVPTYQSMGRWSHGRYIFLLLLTHLAAYYALDSFSYFHLTDVLITFGASLGLSLFLLLLIDSFRRK